MKIGILTIQGLNNGSFLQGFALKTYLEKLGHKVFFIKTMQSKEFVSSIYSLNIIFEIKRIFTLLSAWKSQPATTRLKSYDAIIIGSDVVWKKNRLIYYGYGVDAKKKIAYAPSSHGNTYNNLNIHAIAGLKKIDALSARDAKTAEMVRKSKGIRPPIVVDPAFLIDWTPFERGKVTEDDYVLIYSYSAKQKPMRKKAFSMNKPLVSIANYYDWCDVSIPDASPFEFLTWMKNADCVLTDTFHGTVFSLIYKRPFVSYPKSHKVAFQLETLGIPPCKIFSDYSSIEQTMETMIDQSKKYLNNALGFKDNCKNCIR